MPTNTTIDETERYVPKNLHLWEYPEYYMGESYDEYYPIVGRSRDSDIMEESNFRSMTRDAEKMAEEAKASGSVEPEDHEWIISPVATHWLCGWVETLMVHKDAPDAILQWADETVLYLESDYPVYDDTDYADLEDEKQREFLDGNLQFWFFKELNTSTRIEESKTDEEWLDYIQALIFEYGLEWEGAWIDLAKVAKLSEFYSKENEEGGFGP